MTNQLIEHLMRGGTYGHYWSKQSKRTLWWEVGSIPQVVDNGEDLYFGVHPSLVCKGPTEATTLDDIEAVNCFYGDFDAKDFNNDKEALYGHLEDLELPPSVIVDSGGGYHGYWLLEETVYLDTPEVRAAVTEIQRRWVKEVGADPDVHDLARILRIPGTTNYKEEYDSPRPVEIIEEDHDVLYDLVDFEELLGPPSTVVDKKTEYPKPAKPNDLTPQETVNLILASKQGDMFRKLALGNDSEYGNNASNADLAFCDVLAFWTGGDPQKIDRIFRASSRMRDKWEREDYRSKTIMKALAGCKEYYIRPDGLLTASADDYGNALCVSAQFPRKFLYTEATGWLWYTDTHWESENAEASVRTAIAETLRRRHKAAYDAGKAGIGKVTKRDNTRITACLACLKTILTVSLKEFELSPDYLNCLNGVVDLCTGTKEPHSPDQRFQYCIPVEYSPQAATDGWTSWLLEAAGDKQEVVDYLQMAVGYSVTGRTREEVLFYIFGPARGGKGLFIETILALLGGKPLAVEVGIENFMTSKHGTSSDGKFFLASLRNTRFVAASESKDKHWLDESKIKRWTGGNEVYVRHLYQKHFGYRPQFKLWLTSNIPPKMDYEDDAAWSRVRVIHFPKSWLGKEDKTLKEKMRAPEVLEGLLTWIVEGAIRWYKLPRTGLRAPEVIVAETKVARHALDYTQMWLDSTQILITGQREDVLVYREVRNSYEDWCGGADIKPRPLAHWKKDLESKGMLRVADNAQGTMKDGTKKVVRSIRGVRYVGKKD